jgi:hypothetical protein
MGRSMPDQTRALHETWFAATVREGQPIVEGLASARLGHRIDLPDGRVGGNWVEWHWDGASLTVTSDRFGLYPLYYHASDARVVVSPSIDRILGAGVPRELDPDALAAFLALGYYLGVDTPFPAIRSEAS